MKIFKYSIYSICFGFLALSVLNAGCSSNKSLKQSLVGSKAKSNSPGSFKVFKKEKPIQSVEQKISTPLFNDEPLPLPVQDAKIVVSKKGRKLFLFSGKKLLREYPIKIGLNPVDDKVKQGDYCTPEGKYYVCVRNPRSKYYLSLGLSYPNIDDAADGLENNLINKSQHDGIVRRIKKRQIPPWNTRLGGEIFIHGDGEIYDWTYGCIALNNDDIEELYSVIKIGTPVEITK